MLHSVVCLNCERPLGPGGCEGTASCLAYLAHHRRRWGAITDFGPAGLKVGLELLFSKNEELEATNGRLRNQLESFVQRLASAESKADLYEESLTQLLAYCMKHEENLAGNLDRESRVKADTFRTIELVIMKLKRDGRNLTTEERDLLRELEVHADGLRDYLVSIAGLDPEASMIGGYDAAKKAVLNVRQEIDSRESGG